MLSDVPIRDLRPGLDYIYDKNHVLYAWKDLDPYCVITGSSIDDDHVFGGPSLLRPLGPARPNFSPGTGYPSMRPDDMYPDAKPYFKPGGYHHGAIPFDPDKPDPIRPHRPGGSYGDKFDGIRPGGFGPLYRKYILQLKILLFTKSYMIRFTLFFLISGRIFDFPLLHGKRLPVQEGYEV